jgi:tRNA U34 5-methylaminomethyl-2-thiouridine-forming methyltransferase MnmC
MAEKTQIALHGQSMRLASSVMDAVQNNPFDRKRPSTCWEMDLLGLPNGLGAAPVGPEGTAASALRARIALERCGDVVMARKLYKKSRARVLAFEAGRR